jgi:hypothetical protein
MFHAKTCQTYTCTDLITILNTSGLESYINYWYQKKVSTQIARVARTYSTWYLAANKEVADRNIGIPPVRKYANYRTLLIFNQLISKLG